MNPEKIVTHAARRGFPSWHEYAKVTRRVHVEQRKVAIGVIYDAWLPNGVKIDSVDIECVLAIATAHGCHAIEITAGGAQ